MRVLGTLRDGGDVRVVRLSTESGPRLALVAADAHTERLEAIAQAHAAVAPATEAARPCWIPATLGPFVRAAGQVSLVFDVDAELTLATLLDDLIRRHLRVPYGGALAFVDGMTHSLAAAHAVGHHVGALSWEHVFLSRAGDLALLGLGGDVLGPSAARPIGHVEAGEGSMGAPLDVASDVYAAFALFQSLARTTEVPPQLAAALGGRDDASAPALVARMRRFAQSALSMVAADRPTSMESANREVRAFHAPLGLDPDADGLRAFVASEVARILGSPGTTAEGPWLAWDASRQTLSLSSGAFIDLATRRALRLIAQHLTELHLSHPARTASIDELRDACWPDESIDLEAGRRRAYVAVSTLRKLGLAPFIQRTDEGYRLALELRVVAP
jgi:hypothetical protein